MVFVVPASASFCEDSKYDLASEYMDGGLYYADLPNVDRISEWAGRELYALATYVDNAKGC